MQPEGRKQNIVTLRHYDLSHSSFQLIMNYAYNPKLFPKCCLNGQTTCTYAFGPCDPQNLDTFVWRHADSWKHDVTHASNYGQNRMWKMWKILAKLVVKNLLMWNSDIITGVLYQLFPIKHPISFRSDILQFIRTTSTRNLHCRRIFLCSYNMKIVKVKVKMQGKVHISSVSLLTCFIFFILSRW